MASVTHMREPCSVCGTFGHLCRSCNRPPQSFHEYVESLPDVEYENHSAEHRLVRA